MPVRHLDRDAVAALFEFLPAAPGSRAPAPVQVSTLAAPVILRYYHASRLERLP